MERTTVRGLWPYREETVNERTDEENVDRLSKIGFGRRYELDTVVLQSKEKPTAAEEAKVSRRLRASDRSQEKGERRRKRKGRGGRVCG
jgi:hypothetical protein